MPIILALYAVVLGLAVWQEQHGRDFEGEADRVGEREQPADCCH